MLVRRGKKDIFNSPAGRVFDVFNYILMGLFGFATLSPFVYVVAGSFATELELTTRSFFLIPHTFTLEAYHYIFQTGTVINAMIRTVGVTIAGTCVHLFFTFTMAYALSKPFLRGRSIVLKLVIFTMLFGGGMIPTYMLIKNLNMLNTYWALILPGAISPFNLMIVRNNFQEFPTELIEAAKIDGCSEIQTFIRIVLPLSKPTIATFTLFYAVGIWNDFFSSFLYIADSNKWTIQVILRQITLMSATSLDSVVENIIEVPKKAVKLAAIAITTFPILCVYPFLQKHFAKGMMVGSIKG